MSIKAPCLRQGHPPSSRTFLGSANSRRSRSDRTPRRGLPMPTWNEINSEIDDLASAKACDQIRQKYLSALSALSDRPVIAYYSGFLQKKNPDGGFHPEIAITDHD